MNFSLPRLFWLSAGVCALLYLILGFVPADHDQILPIFLTIGICAAGVSTWVLLRFQREGQEIPIGWIVVTAMAFRLIGVFSQPFLEDDFYRYLWDGYRTATSNDPFTLAPAVFFTSENLPQGFEEILSRINYPDIATVYGPVCQWIFAIGYLISPGELWPLQGIFALADLGILLLLAKMKRNNFLLLYAWSPLLIKEFAFTAHPDAAAVFLMLLALWLSSMRLRFIAGAVLGLAIGIKVFAILMLPFLIFAPQPNQSQQPNLTTRFAAGLPGLALVLSGLIFSATIITFAFGNPGIWFPDGLQAMAKQWVFNAPIYLLLQNTLPNAAIKLIAVGTFLAWLGWHWRAAMLSNALQPWRRFRGDWVFGALLIALPVLNPWYAVWVLPFAVIFPTRWAWIASITLLMSYLSGVYLNTGIDRSYQIPTLFLCLEFGVIALAWIWDIRRPLLKAR